MQYNFYTSPPNYRSYIKKLCELKRDFPFLEVSSIGQSVLGREIYAIGIGNMQNVTLFAGAFHAQEWLTCSLLVRYIEQLATSCKEKTTICGFGINQSLKQRGIVIVPMVNPDGVSIALEGASSAGYLRNFVDSIMESSNRSWQANARGVDLNHNYNAGYKQLKELERSAGITSPSPRQYGGECAHSEPETRAMITLLQGRNVETVYAFHSQGEEIFYEYGLNTPPKSFYIAELLSKVSGYKLVKNDGLCSHGGFKDYFIDKFYRPGFTIEIGKGENPLPITDLERIYHKVLEMMLVATVI
ncbi:MAG: M14 family metallocarboxypeptidase [Oscillospiraceae bacterium]